METSGAVVGSGCADSRLEVLPVLEVITWSIPALEVSAISTVEQLTSI